MDPGTPPADGFYFLNVTIPARYNLTLPAPGKTVGNYTMLNTTADKDQVLINITSNNPTADPETVDVTYSTDYGGSSSTILNQPITNMIIGVSSLKITKPTSTTPGYLNLSLGGTAGPVLSKHKVTVKLAKGTLRNPNISGEYTWYLEAKNAPAGTPNTSSDVVVIKGGSSTVKEVQVLNATNPVSANLTLPSGNLTVNITAPPGVNVTDFVVTLRNFTEDPIPGKKTGVESLSRMMFIGVDAPDLRGVTFNATIRVDYSSVILLLTIPEANLRLYRFNDSTDTWELTADSGVDTTNKIVFGNVTGFSIFGVMGAGAVSPGGDGGGGSGGGVSSSEPLDNIAKAERYDKDLIANAPVTYTFTAPEHGITEIAITGKENENAITLRVEALKGASKLVTVSPPGTVYRNVNVWAGTKRIKEAVIRFKVDNSWLTGNSVASSDVKMVKWDGSKWVQLETSEKTKDASFTFFEAKTDSFSVFAITGLKGVEVPTATPAVAVTETVKPTVAATTSAPTEKVPGFELALSAAALCAVYLFSRKRR